MKIETFVPAMGTEIGDAVKQAMGMTRPGVTIRLQFNYVHSIIVTPQVSETDVLERFKQRVSVSVIWNLTGQTLKFDEGDVPADGDLKVKLASREQSDVNGVTTGVVEMKIKTRQYWYEVLLEDLPQGAVHGDVIIVKKTVYDEICSATNPSTLSHFHFYWYENGSLAQ